MSNILLVWDRLGDYHRARVRALQEIRPANSVFYGDLGAADKLYKWSNSDQSDAQYILLSDKPVDEPDITERLARFKKVIKEKNIKVVGIAGYGRKEYRLFLWYCYQQKIKVVLFAESWYGNNFLFNQLKGTILRLFCNGFLVSGERAKQHFHRQLGVPFSKIKIGYSAVDNRHFSSIPKINRDEKQILLCVARFSEEKNLALLMKAYQASDLNGHFKLLLVGGGNQESELRKIANNHEDIEFRNWVSYQDLPALYASASYFILPSSFEPWGLVANEAACAGLPLVLSEQCGCLPELLDEKNGFSFDAFKKEELIKILNNIKNIDKNSYELMSSHSRLKVAAISPENWANNFLELSN